MIQINLIPDIKREFLHAQQMRRVAITISILVGLIAAGIVVLLGIILGGQELLITKSQNDIKKNYTSLKNVDNVDNVLTLQNQLSQLNGIYSKHSTDSRVFDLLSAVNPPAPNNVTYSTIKVDPTTSTITVEGSAPNGYAATETFRKTILNTKIESNDSGQMTTTPLTSEVTISDTSYGQSADGSQVLRFTVSFVYASGLLDYQMKSPRIVTPTGSLDVTDSTTRVPDSLFSQKATDTTKGGN